MILNIGLDYETLCLYQTKAVLTPRHSWLLTLKNIN